MECNLHFGCPYCEGLKVMVAQSTFRDTKQDKKKKKKKKATAVLREKEFTTKGCLKTNS